MWNDDDETRLSLFMDMLNGFKGILFLQTQFALESTAQFKLDGLNVRSPIFIPHPVSYL